MSETAKSAVVARTGLSLELAALNMTLGLRRSADDIVARLKMVCPEGSRLRTAGEMRAVARSLQYAAEHIAANADALEVSHAS